MHFDNHLDSAYFFPVLVLLNIKSQIGIGLTILHLHNCPMLTLIVITNMQRQFLFFYTAPQ